VAAGAGIGGLIGLGVLSGVLPVIGPAIAAGTLGVILSNVAAGGAIVGIIGALIGMGIPEEEANYYEGEVKAGRYLVTVHAGSRNAEAWEIMHRHGAYSHQHRPNTATAQASTMRSTGAASATTGARTAAAGENMTLHEEKLHAKKQPVKTGEVRVHKEVVTEHQTMNVPVQREEVVIERRPATGQAATGHDMRPGEEIRIPVKEEQVRVEKETVATENVKVGKRKVQENEQVSGTVRKEQVRVDRQGDVDIKNKR